MKEIMQEIVLCGLSRAGFFQKAAFYGGTALRIFYGLDRFSEDLDFSLETADASFELASYFPVLEKEVKAFGLNVAIVEKEKTRESHIRSAFLKGNTKEHLLLFYDDAQTAGSVARNVLCRRLKKCCTIVLTLSILLKPNAMWNHLFMIHPC